MAMHAQKQKKINPAGRQASTANDSFRSPHPFGTSLNDTNDTHSADTLPGFEIDSSVAPRIGHHFADVRVHAAVPEMMQTKLTINQPGDTYEQEAERVAEQVMQMEAPTSSEAPPTSQGAKLSADDLLTRKGASDTSVHETTSAPNLVDEVLSNGGGQPLDESTRSYMEPRFGYDFSRVRIHANERAAESARSVNAMAYTVGQDVVFGEGQYAPETSAGKRLLAHELSHVVQQSPRSLQTATETVMQLSPIPPGFLQRHTIHDNYATAVTEFGPVWEVALTIQRAPEEDSDGFKDFKNACLDGIRDAASSFGQGAHVRTHNIRVTMHYRAGLDYAAVSQEAYTLARHSVLGKASEEVSSNAAVSRGGKEQLKPPTSFASQATTTTPAETGEKKEEPKKREEEEQGFGTATPSYRSYSTPGRAAITPDVALEILNNLSRGELPWKPELGTKGGAAFFTTEGSPYTSASPEKSVNVEVELDLKASKPLVFGEKELQALHKQLMQEIAAEAEAVWRSRNGIDPGTPLSKTKLKDLAWFQDKFAESKMWDRIGEMVRNSAEQVGEVILEPGSGFSKTPGKFAVVADSARIQLKGGITRIIETLEAQGIKAEPVVVEAAEAMASKLKWAGRVRGVFRYGGRILIVVAIAHDVYKIYRAQDRVKATIESAGGWAGASAAAAAFAEFWTPADVAGPWAWVAHGVGTLVAGGIGYWIGSNVTRTIYELVLEE